MMKKGKKVGVLSEERYENKWHLVLRCGHETYRPVKRRVDWRSSNVGGIKRVTDPAPTWVYCGLCR